MLKLHNVYSLGMIKPRQLSQAIRAAARSFPAIVVTGPRQSGKTTLIRSLFGETHTYINLENQDTRRRALADPRSLFADLGNTPALFDEIQSLSIEFKKYSTKVVLCSF